jgi:hypothetical protein
MRYGTSQGNPFKYSEYHSWKQGSDPWGMRLSLMETGEAAPKDVLLKLVTSLCGEPCASIVMAYLNKGLELLTPVILAPMWA